MESLASLNTVFRELLKKVDLLEGTSSQNLEATKTVIPIYCFYNLS